MSVKIVTSIFSNLHGTKFGGRPSRGGHYRWSLLSLLKMKDADFTCYCSHNELEDLERFFFNENGVDKNQLTIKPFDLETHYFKELFDKYKDYEKAKSSDRCLEVQYMKFVWGLAESEIGDYEYIYWFDAGLSHCGLIPNKYLSLSGPHNRGYYESSLFNNVFLNNLIKVTGDKFLVVAKENHRNYWSGTVNPKHYKDFDSSRHIIGGFFGGKKNIFSDVVKLFDEYAHNIVEADNYMYHEEELFSLIFRNHQELFHSLEFDIWWHEDERVAGANMEELCKNNKSFYKIIEELN